ncbi:hypothetical protein BH09BAC5_BH09BAC5_13270 [soil metagenome]
MKFRHIAFLLLLPVCGFANAKPPENKTFSVYEDSLKKIGAAMFNGTDQDKIVANTKFTELLRKTLSIDGAFDYPFDSLKFIANLKSSDNAIRIFNWDIPKNDGTYIYYGFLFVDDSKTGAKYKGEKRKFSIYDLTDKSEEIRNPELTVLSPEKWFGALYYKIILTNDKDKKYYTILGWDGNTNATWKKIIDVITFSKEGKPIFGEKNLFVKGKRSSKRVVFEFRADLIMTLRFEEDKKRIVFDHLAPEVSGAEGMYQFYSQTFVYDSFEWKKGKWVLKEDIDARNEKSKKDDQYQNPQGDQNANSNGTTDPKAGSHPHGFFYRLFHR